MKFTNRSTFQFKKENFYPVGSTILDWLANPHKNLETDLAYEFSSQKKLITIHQLMASNSKANL